MLPVGQLMVEHRLIERVIRLWQKELSRIENSGTVNTDFMAQAIDFMRVYADRCHHGKEEDIFFRDLGNKSLSAGLSKILQELIAEHAISRSEIKKLMTARERYIFKDKGSLSDICTAVKKITELYPAHIEKEDKRFFLPCMEYFTQQEKERMIDEFNEFDRRLIHERYKTLIKDLELSVVSD